VDRIGRKLALTALTCSMAVLAAGGTAWAAAPRTGVARGRTSPPAAPAVRSNLALVIDAEEGQTLFSKNANRVAPIASITKLMTAIVVLDAGSSLDELITIERADVDVRKHSASRLPVGARLARGDLLQVSLMASDNRAAAALARSYPGGTPACIEAMNHKAQALGMLSTRFMEPTGLSDGNVSNAEDLARLVQAARGYPKIREATTTDSWSLRLSSGRVLEFLNTNLLVGRKTWDIGLSKTGYINEAGRCLVMEATIAARKVIIVLLDSWGKYTRLGDANRIRKWMEAGVGLPGTTSLPSATAGQAGSTGGQR
jgi:serine-type D-Ala-D-Ala endopeptidase (penicillin-binding protein 7)